VATIVRTTSETTSTCSLLATASLVILLAGGGLQIFNPATRQRAPLTLLHGAACISALYPHWPSGSYRVRCCFKRVEDDHAVCRFFSLLPVLDREGEVLILSDRGESGILWQHLYHMLI